LTKRILVMQHVLLVDMDGTLVDTLPDLAASMNHTLAAMGQPTRSADEVRSAVGSGAIAMLAKVLASGHPDPDQLEKAKQIFLAHYDQTLLTHSRPYAGWAEVLSSDIPLVCATNKSERFAKKILEGLGLTNRFLLLVGGDTLPVKKPDVGVADYIGNKLDKRKENFIIVGDGIPDGQLANNVGFPFWGARWGYSEVDVLAPYGPLWLDNPADILHHWKKL
jgi:phosphoglycolate phosphatase